MRRKVAAGNWKMHGGKANLAEVAALLNAVSDPGCDVVICPAATLIAPMAEATHQAYIHVGGQDCHGELEGAHTGDISAEMIADAGGTHVIVGHSERRTDHREDDALIHGKALAAYRAGLVAIICVGETLTERDAGQALDVVGQQLADSVPDSATAANTIIAYEPVWAIGTGRTPSLADIEEMHSDIRARLTSRFGGDIANGIRILYGGSVKPGNAAEIFAVPDVDGGLVGGASLKAADFARIVKAAG